MSLALLNQLPAHSCAAPAASRIADVRNSLKNSAASTVTLRGTVTALSGWQNSFFLQDPSGAISIDRRENTTVTAGDEVEVTGDVKPGLFAPILLSSSTKVLRHPGLPPALPVQYSQLFGGQLDSRLVEIEGVIHSARLEDVWGRKTVLLSLHTPGGVLNARVLQSSPAGYDSLIDSTVRVTGVAGTIFNDRKQTLGIRLFVPTLASPALDPIQIRERAPPMESLPYTPLTRLMTFGGPHLQRRVRLLATVTYRNEAGDLFLQQGSSGLRAHISSPEVFLPGDQVELWGYVSNSGFGLRLIDPIVRRIGRAPEISPVRVAAADVLKMEDGFTLAPYDGILIRLEGVLKERPHNSRRQYLELQDGPTTFQAELQSLSPMQTIEIEPGTRLAVTGVCVLDADLAGGNDDANVKTFRVLIRSANDLASVRSSHWNSTLVLLAGILLFALTGAGCVWLAHRGATPSDLSSPESLQMLSRFRRASTILAALAGSSGLVMLAGWNFYSPHVPAAISDLIRPNTALAIVLGAVALLAGPRSQGRRKFVWAAAIAGAILIGAASLAEFLLHRDFGIDTLAILFRTATVDVRLRPGAAVCVLLVSLAIALMRFCRGTATGQILAASAAILCALSLIASIYGLMKPNGAEAQSLLRPAAAFAMALLSAAILFSYPAEGPVTSLSSIGPGGILARRIMPLAILSPVVIGYIRLQGQLAGLYDTRYGLALFALSNVASFSFLVWASAGILNRMDRARSRAEQLTSARDQKLDLVFGSGKIGDFTWDIPSDTVTAHPSVYKLYGEPEGRGTLPGDWFRSRQHPVDMKIAEREVTAAVRNGLPLDIEYRVLWPDGTVRWIECRGNPVYGEDGKVVQINGLNLDITERKLAQIRQRETEVRFQELADAIPQIVWITEIDGATSYRNRRWSEYTGLQSPDWASTIHPDDRESYERGLTHASAAASALQSEVRLRHHGDGLYRWHLVRSIPVHDQNGRLVKWFGTATDIDDFKNAAALVEALNDDLEMRVFERSRELAESEGRYRQLLEGAHDYALFMLDACGFVTSWNSGAQKNQGYSEEEILGKHFSIFYSREDIERNHPDHELQYAAEHGAYREEGLRVRKDGSTFAASVQISAMRSLDGEICGYTKVVRDMTDQRRTEALLRAASHRAEDANRAKGAFLASMSHEIRTPMNAILGMADLLWETELDAMQREYVGRFRRAGTNLLALINDILDFSKIESLGFTLETVEFNLLEVVSRTTELMEGRARAKNITLTVEVDPATPVDLMGDPGRIHQVLVNLIGNAVKFTEMGGVVLRIQPHEGGLPGRLRFDVEDTGIGIPDDQIERIFEDFQQGENSTSRRFGGTGLGLGICRRLVERMGGKLSASSEFGRGSTFSFDCFFELAHSAGPESVDPLDLSGVRVLIVDGNQTHCLLEAGMCASCGMLTGQVSGLDMALDMLRDNRSSKQPFFLVILDQSIVEAEGPGTLERILAFDHRLKAIVTSSESQPGDLTRARALGASAYLARPIRRADLLRAISESLRSNTIPPPEPPAPESIADPGSPLSPIDILIAEDSEDNRFLLAAYFRSTPYRLTFAINGEEAVNLFGQNEFDLVLMDYQMPIMDGLQATSRIRRMERQYSWKPAKIVALTANALAEDAEATLAAGCDAHLAKPISKARLISVIESYRDSYRTPAPAAPLSDTFLDDAAGDEESRRAIAELAQGYIASQRAALEKIRAAESPLDLLAIQRLAHNIKGTAASYGFPELGLLGGAMESAAKRADLDSVQSNLTDMCELIDTKSRSAS